MALIEKIKAIADAIREKTGSTGLMNLDEMAEMITAMNASGGATTLDNTYILVDEDGYEIPAVLTEEEVVLTATAASDIRAGTTAVTDEGVVTGEKEIPGYVTTQGKIRVSPGSSCVIRMYSDTCQYTKFQAVVCNWNTTMNDSVATEMVVLGDKVYEVRSTVEKASITVDPDMQTINLGVTNDTDDYLVIAYMTIKEDT